MSRVCSTRNPYTETSHACQTVIGHNRSFDIGAGIADNLMHRSVETLNSITDAPKFINTLDLRREHVQD